MLDDAYRRKRVTAKMGVTFAKGFIYLNIEMTQPNI
jgi:hypothetical protein